MRYLRTIMVTLWAILIFTTCRTTSWSSDSIGFPHEGILPLRDRKPPQIQNALLARQSDEDVRVRSAEEKHEIQGIPFIKRSTYSSLTTSIRMVLKYWNAKDDLLEKEIAAIEFGGREPSLADAWLLLSGRGYTSLIFANNSDLIKLLIRQNIPVIVMGERSSTCRILTGYDERTTTVSYLDPDEDSQMRSVVMNESWQRADALIVMPGKLITSQLDKDQDAGSNVIVELYDLTLTKAAVAIGTEKDGSSLVENVYKLYPQSHEVKLYMADRLYARREYEQAIIRLQEVLLVPGISRRIRFLACLTLAASYNRQGDSLQAEKYRSQATAIDPNGDKAYELLLRSSSSTSMR